MEIHTKRLRIVPCTSTSIKIALKQSYDNGPQIFNSLKQLEEDPSLLFWGTWLVISKEDGTVVGDIGFKGKPDIHKVVEVGYGFLEDFRNKGYATESVQALINWAFNSSKVDKVIAETLKDNNGSIRVLKKLNMNLVHETEEHMYWGLDNRKTTTQVQNHKYKQVNQKDSY